MAPLSNSISVPYSTSNSPAISAHTRTIAIIGDPISHSITPRVQNVALREIGADIVNVAFRVTPENVSEAVRGAHKMGLLGLMVTIPHKEAVLNLCDELHPSAQLLGAANLLEFRSDGTIVGHSSDGWGALQALKESGVQIEGARIVFLGGGGSARSLAVTLADAGATHIALCNRTVERAATIAAEVEKMGVSASASAPETNALKAALEKADVVINTTSIGMTPNIEATPLDASLLSSRHTVFDIVYNPLETRLLREAKAQGAQVVNGLDMVLYTNVYAVKICAGLDISMATLRAEALRALGG